MELSGAGGAGAVVVHGDVLQRGSAAGRLLVLDKALSFWGGVDPLTGIVADPRHPQHGYELGGRILVMERTIGSSSSSAIMLELLRGGAAPAGIVLGRADAILMLGILVADELGYPTVPVVRIPGIRRLAGFDGCPATLDDGVLEVQGTA